MNRLVFRLALQVFAFSILGTSTILAVAEQTVDPDQELKEFLGQTFLDNTDAQILATSIDVVVGQYLVKRNGVVQLMGDRINTLTSPKKFELKNRLVFHRLYTKDKKVDFSVAALLTFSLGGETNALDELTITDNVGVSDDTVTYGACQAKRPPGLIGNEPYWCLAGVMLSSIETNRYMKVKKMMGASYGIATASGTYAGDNESKTNKFVASITARGPFYPDGSSTPPLAVISSPAPTPPTSASKLNGMILKMPSSKGPGLDGSVLQLKHTAGTDVLN